MPNREQISLNIKVQLLKNGLNVTELAKKIGYSQITVYRKLRGEADWKLEDLEKIATVCNCKVGALMKK